MERATLLGGIITAAVLSLGSIPLRWVFQLLCGNDLGARLSIVALAVMYCFFLLSRRGRRVGSFTIGVGIVALFAAAIALGWNFVLLIWVATGCGWFVRSLTRYCSLAMAVCDGAVAIAAVAFASIALGASGSPTIAVWVYFLVLALTALLPAAIERTTRPIASSQPQANPFEQAFATAEVALREIVKRQAVS